MDSFDVFDTLITRSTATPKGIFMLMQKAIQESGRYDPFVTANFYELRTGAEQLARRCAVLRGKQEITLDDIYHGLSSTANISDAQQEELKRLEIETECSHVLGITKNIRLLKGLKDQGEHVVLISDMYLDERVIRRMLCLVDPIFTELPLYVSSNVGKTKGNGELFKVVQMREQAAFSDWVHYGDNEHSDIEEARKLGIKAVFVRPERLKEYEHPGKDWYHQLSVGVSKYIRSKEEDSPAREVGASLAGPILYPYISWVLHESRRRGINRLYFVSGDGWLLQQMADIMIRWGKCLIKTSYIYGSRSSWRFPSFDGSKDSFEQIVYHSSPEKLCSLNDLASLFSMDIETLKGFLPERLKSVCGTQKLSRVHIDTISKWLQENKDFRKYLLESQKRDRSLTVRYLQQELDVSDDKFAFVELSGTGFTQQCLANIIGDFYQGEIKNFFYRMDYVLEDKKCRFIQFYPGSLKWFVFELLCRAPHGQVKGYREENERIVPVLEPKEGKEMKEYYIEEYRDMVLAYVEHMENIRIKSNLPHVQNMSIVKEYAELIAQDPPKRIAEYFCHMPFSSSRKEGFGVEFAPPVSKKQLRKLYFWNRGSNVHQIYQGDCIEYALQISGESARYKEKCERYRTRGAGKWLTDQYQYLQTHQKPGTDFFCPWEMLEGDIVIYGAGKVGQAFVKQAKQSYAKCHSLLWVDSNYMELQRWGMDVKAPEEILLGSYDRIIIAIHNHTVRQEIWDKLQDMGVETEKLYYG